MSANDNIPTPTVNVWELETIWKNRPYLKHGDFVDHEGQYVGQIINISDGIALAFHLPFSGSWPFIEIRASDA